MRNLYGQIGVIADKVRQVPWVQVQMLPKVYPLFPVYAARLIKRTENGDKRQKNDLCIISHFFSSLQGHSLKSVIHREYWSFYLYTGVEKR